MLTGAERDPGVAGTLRLLLRLPLQSSEPDLPLEAAGVKF